MWAMRVRMDDQVVKPVVQTVVEHFRIEFSRDPAEENPDTSFVIADSNHQSSLLQPAEGDQTGFNLIRMPPNAFSF